MLGRSVAVALMVGALSALVPAIVLALIPNIAAWGKLPIDSALGAAGTSVSQIGLDKLAQVGVLYHGLEVLAGGAILAGMILGNRPLRAQASIVTVNDAATWLSQIVMFMVLGLLVTPSRLIALRNSIDCSPMRASSMA